jgi:hypothetical protein
MPELSLDFSSPYETVWTSGYNQALRDVAEANGFLSDWPDSPKPPNADEDVDGQLRRLTADRNAWQSLAEDYIKANIKNLVEILNLQMRLEDALYEDVDDVD